MKPLVDQGKQAIQMGLKIGALGGLLRQGHQLQIPQRFEAIAQAIGIIVDGQHPQLCPVGLGIEAKD